jgi:hypothetical protein
VLLPWDRRDGDDEPLPPLLHVAGRVYVAWRVYGAC